MRNALPLVLVTGASGFIGQHLARVLVRNGWAVRRIVRTLSGSADEFVVDSIGPTTEWQAVLTGVDAVVHLAARVRYQHEEPNSIATSISRGRSSLRVAPRMLA